MAELFSYQGQQGIVNPQSPFVQATPAKSPFSNVSELLLTAQKAQLNLKTLETNDLREQQRAANIDYDAALTEAYLREDQKQAVMYQDWQKSFLEVGTDVNKQREVTQAYLAESKTAFDSVPPEVQAKIITSTQAGQQNANNSFLKSEFAYNKEETRSTILGSLPSWLNTNGEEQGIKFKEMQNLAVTKGWTKQEFGKWFIGSAFNTLYTNIDESALLLDTEEGLRQVDNFKTQVEGLISLDPNNTVDNLNMQRIAQDLRKKIATEVKGNITTTIQTGESDKFNQSNDVALREGLINKEEHESNQLRFIQATTNATSLSKQAARNGFTAQGSTRPLALISDPTEKTEATKLVTEDLTKQIIDPNTNYDYLSKSAAVNKPTYATVFRPIFDNVLNDMAAFAQSKDVTMEGLQQRLQIANEISLRAFGTKTKDQIIKLGVAKAMMSSGNAADLGKAFTIIEGQGGEPNLLPKSNKEVKSMLENIPPVDRFAAQVQMSTLVNIAGVSDVEAREFTEKAYGYSELSSDKVTDSIRIRSNGMPVGQGVRTGQLGELSETDKLKLNTHNADNVKMSNSMLEMLSTSDMGLISSSTFYYMLSNETVTNPLGEEARDQITTITAKTNPRISFDNNVLTVTNDEGDRFVKFLSNEQMKSLVNDSNDIYRAANPPSAWSKISSDFANGTYKLFKELGEGPKDNFNLQTSLDNYIDTLNVLADSIANPQQPFTQPTTNQPSIQDATNFKQRRSPSSKDWYQQSNAKTIEFVSRANNLVTSISKGELDSNQTKLVEKEIKGLKKEAEKLIGKTSEDSEVDGSSAKDFRPKNSIVSLLAKELNIEEKALNRLVQLESSIGGYSAQNPGSSAYGKYQFLTKGDKSSGYEYAKKLGYTGKSGEELRKWMTPKKQDDMFIQKTKDNVKQLEKNGLPIDTFHIYGAHQQGLRGLKTLLKVAQQGGMLPSDVTTNVRQNINKKYKGLSGQALAQAWIKQWQAATQ